MSDNPFIRVAEEIQSINDAIKSQGWYAFENDDNLKEKIKIRLNNILNFAEKNQVPVKISFDSILEKLKQQELGEMEDEDSYSEEDSYEE